MGVPVITLKGNSHAHNVGVSLLKALGYDEFIAKSKEDYMIIFEDDITFPKKEKFIKSLNNVLKNLSLFDLLILGIGKIADDTIYLNEYIYKVKGLFFGLHFYVITKEGAGKALTRI